LKRGPGYTGRLKQGDSQKLVEGKAQSQRRTDGTNYVSPLP